MVPSCASDATDERFAETAWSVVLAAGAATPARAHTAMAELCRIYWRPIYAYLRRSGHQRHDAEDLTQSFFQHLLENETLQRASREKGRFRSFLLGALKRCLADEHMQQHTLKRGGRMQFISTDELEAEELHHLRAHHEAAPDEVLDARWAGVVLERALDKVRAECAAEGKAESVRSAVAISWRNETAHQLSGSGGPDEPRSWRSEDADLPLATAIRERCSARDHADSKRTARGG